MAEQRQKLCADSFEHSPEAKWREGLFCDQIENLTLREKVKYLSLFLNNLKIAEGIIWRKESGLPFWYPFSDLLLAHHSYITHMPLYNLQSYPQLN